MMKLKYRQFLNIVNVHLKRKSHKELKDFVNEIAKRLTESQREEFVELLETKSFSSESDEYKKILKKINSAKESLNKINEGEKSLDSCFNEEWDDWYQSHLDEYIFSDPDGLLDDIKNSIMLVDKCVDMSIFREGCQLCKILCCSEIHTKGDYYEHEYSLLSLEALYEFKLISGKLEDLAKKYLYLCYMKSDKTRHAEMFKIFQQFEYYHLNLKDLLIVGNDEITDFDTFIKSFFHYLGEKDEGFVKKILMEIQTMIQDDSIVFENVKKYGEKKPYLYVQVLEKYQNYGENEDILRLGLDALRKVPENLIIRSQIALLTEDYAEKLNRTELCEYCRLEAFRSDTNVVNYLRLRFLSRHVKVSSNQLKEIIDSNLEEFVKHAGVYKVETERLNHERPNNITKQEYCTLLFFEQQFEKMERLGMSAEEVFGFSSFMRRGISLILLLLYRGTKHSEGIQSLLRSIVVDFSFSKESFYRGAGSHDDKSHEEIFYEIFRLWKDEAYLSKKDETYWQKKIEMWIDKRVNEVMRENLRNYYGECASFLAAFGEVVESLGERGAKERILNHYKKEYSKRRKFKDELRKFE